MGGGPPGGIHMAGAIPPGQAWWHSRLYPEGEFIWNYFPYCLKGV